MIWKLQKCEMAVVAMVAGTVMWASALPAQNLLTNGSFNSDVAGWTVKEGNAEISWDGANGSPSPGSLRLSSTRVSSAFEAVGPCIETIEDEVLAVTGRVLEPAAPGITCFITITIYSESDNCTGSRTITGNVPPNMSSTGMVVLVLLLSMCAATTIHMRNKRCD